MNNHVFAFTISAEMCQTISLVTLTFFLLKMSQTPWCPLTKKVTFLSDLCYAMLNKIKYKTSVGNPLLSFLPIGLNPSSFSWMKTRGRSLLNHEKCYAEDHGASMEKSHVRLTSYLQLQIICIVLIVVLASTMLLCWRDNV